ncbi:glycerol-3-phosphate responsive antiterminator [Priestia taiwanensis]|uniref:Glycerol uptake operon antiterminator regulatory protein n=1 Tax=Priestia taiwanensis TaxID=1347902 RepID=A0A917AT75_9BACI|nr:glycerol-3-phosphate responsive antiterminator [Priestia taiwanensis]MBM7364308.1 glycerol uptake operon antiterminator [Priestia taiwanensis]GGE73403.1 glycerol uptake operon antiterminator regulatory protein [Priestia taiwanensis]
MFNGQKILPAARGMKDFEKLLTTSYEYIVVLDLHIAQIKNIMKMAEQYKKKIFLHVDLIHGLQSDTYATEYLCQEFKPYGLMSTKANVILKAKQKGVIAVQRIFLLDSGAVDKSYALLERTKPDFIEVLPGAMSFIINEIKEKTKIPILAGGFIRTVEDVERAIEAGTTAITTSNRELWKYYEK